jgi:hypothetical protein
VLARIPERIDRVTISGGIFDVRVALARLAAHVAEANGDADLARMDPADTWGLASRLFSIPNVLDFYWSPRASEQRAAMMALAGSGQLLHGPTFENVLRDFFQHADTFAVRSWEGPVTVLLGRYDPYARDDDLPIWRGVFPLARFEQVDAGHFPHLELSPEAWLP